MGDATEVIDVITVCACERGVLEDGYDVRCRDCVEKPDGFDVAAERRTDELTRDMAGPGASGHRADENRSAQRSRTPAPAALSVPDVQPPLPELHRALAEIRFRHRVSSRGLDKRAAAAARRSIGSERGGGDPGP